MRSACAHTSVVLPNSPGRVLPGRLAANVAADEVHRYVTGPATCSERPGPQPKERPYPRQKELPRYRVRRRTGSHLPGVYAAAVPP